MSAKEARDLVTAGVFRDPSSAGAYAKCIGALFRLRIWAPDCGGIAQPAVESAKASLPQQQQPSDRDLG